MEDVFKEAVFSPLAALHSALGCRSKRDLEQVSWKHLEL